VERLDNLGAELAMERPEEYTTDLAKQYELFSEIFKIIKKNSLHSWSLFAHNDVGGIQHSDGGEK